MSSGPSRAVTPAVLPTAVYLFVSVALIAGYPLMSLIARDVVFLLVAWAAMALVAIRLARLPHGERLPWWLLASGLLAGNLAGSVRRLPAVPLEIVHGFGVLDAFGSLLFLAGALIVVVRRGRNDAGGLIDALIVSLAVGGVLTAVLILPNLNAAGTRLTAPGKLLLALSILLLCGVLGSLLHLWFTARRDRRTLGLLLAAIVITLAGNIALAVWDEPKMVYVQVCFLLAYTAVGVFALDPAAVALSRPEPGPPTEHLRASRLVWLGLALAALPLAAACPVVGGGQVEGVVIAVGGAAIALLAMLRIGLLSARRSDAEKALRHLATHDPLTGVLNRRAFVARLDYELAQRNPCVVAFCDLDSFKEVNDRFGHAAGDRLLLDATQRLRGCLRPTDTIGRLGGDEFVVLCGDASPDAVSLIGQRLRAAFAEPFAISGVPVSVGISVGAVAAPSRGGYSADELIGQADHAMYRAKAGAKR